MNIHDVFREERSLLLSSPRADGIGAGLLLGSDLSWAVQPLGQPAHLVHPGGSMSLWSGQDDPWCILLDARIDPRPYLTNGLRVLAYHLPDWGVPIAAYSPRPISIEDPTGHLYFSGMYLFSQMSKGITVPGLMPDLSRFLNPSGIQLLPVGGGAIWQSPPPVFDSEWSILPLGPQHTYG